MEKAKLEVQFVKGRRYTDQRTLAIVEHVLVREINERMCKMIEDLGSSAMGLHSLSTNVLLAEKLYLAEDDRKIDIGLVGEVTGVNSRLLELLCQADMIPVIAPIARDSTGGKLNCNGDTVAGEVAAALKAEKLVMLSDTHGIRRDPADPQSLMTSADEKEIREMIKTGAVGGGMLPKVEACLRALDAGVRRTHIIDGKYPHALLLEMFTDKGVGTLITK
jgi:acetylglutamate kinase